MATELGKAYVQIVPSARGIAGSITKELSGEADVAGKSVGTKLIGAIKGVIATAAIGKAIGASLSGGAELQQSLGGVETLFKGSADKVKKQAEEAYRTTGLSANAYMENVTGFSASLLQSLGGDTEKAAAISNMAMIDMADNSNKMGTAMGSIQDAYQGFAKQNYTMLDNLKLGYGGTKTEMERLLADATKLTGVKYDINNLSDVFEAIHAIQNEIGITGTTVLEAEETFTGSFNAMKAAAQNVLGTLALGEGLRPALEGLAQTVSTFLFGNFLPMVMNILSSLPSAIAIFFQTAAPLFMEAGGQFLSNLSTGISTGLPNLMAQVTTIVTSISTWLTTSFPTIVQKGTELITNLINGIVTAIPQVVTGISQLISLIGSTLATALPTLMQAGVEILTNLLNGIISAVPSVLNGIGTLISSIIDTIGTILPVIFAKGLEIITQFATEMLQALPGQISSVGNSLNSNFQEILDAVFRILSDVMPKMLDKGFEMLSKIVQGVAKNMPAVVRAILEVVTKLITTLAQNLPEFLQKGVELIERLARGVSQNMPAIVSTIGTVLTKVIAEIVRHLPQILQKGVELIVKLAAGLIQAIPRVISAAGQILRGILTSIAGFVGQMVSAGYNLLMGLAQGISNAVGRVIGRAIEAAKGVVSAVKNFFGIRSPSRVFAEIGAYIDEGLAEGIADNTGPITKAMDEVSALTERSFESEIAMRASATTAFTGSGQMESQGANLNQIVMLLELLLRKNSNVYIDGDTLIGEILDDIDKRLADKQNVTDLAYGGA